MQYEKSISLQTWVTEMKSEDFWNSRKRFSHSVCKSFGIPIRFHYSMYLTLILFALYGLTKNVDFSKPWPGLLNEGISLFFLTTIFASILLHELGHASVAVILKRKVHGIIIYPFLGGTVFKHSKKLSARNDILVISAGPLINFAIAWFLSHLSSINFVNAVVKVNIWIGCMNLVPLFPLDGGRILKSMLTLKGWSNARINSVVLNSSRLSALGIGVAAFRSGDYVLLVFTILLLLAAHAEFSSSE